MAQVVATVVVDFGAEDENAGILRYEVDSRTRAEGGLNLGRTQFQPGDNVYLLLYRSDNISSLIVDSNEGSIASDGDETIAVDELLTISNAEDVTLPYPVLSGFTAAWAGNEFASDGTSAAISRTLVEGRKVVFSEPAIGHLRVTYNTRAYIYRLNNIPQGVNKVFTFAVGQVT